MNSDLALLTTQSTNGLTKQPLVLAIDDDDDNLLLLSYALELFDCAFISQTNCQNALELVQQHQPDLILLDIVLPDMNGIDFIRQLRQSPATAELPVVAVTGLAGSDNQNHLLSNGFSDYICKPFMLEDLEVLIHRYI